MTMRKALLLGLTRAEKYNERRKWLKKGWVAPTRFRSRCYIEQTILFSLNSLARIIWRQQVVRNWRNVFSRIIDHLWSFLCVHSNMFSFEGSIAGCNGRRIWHKWSDEWGICGHQSQGCWSSCHSFFCWSCSVWCEDLWNMCVKIFFVFISARVLFKRFERLGGGTRSRFIFWRKKCDTDDKGQR